MIETACDKSIAGFIGRLKVTPNHKEKRMNWLNNITQFIFNFIPPPGVSKSAVSCANAMTAVQQTLDRVKGGLTENHFIDNYRSCRQVEVAQGILRAGVPKLNPLLTSPAPSTSTPSPN